MSDAELVCHWTHPHRTHEWTPLVADPRHDRVLHLFPDAPLTCPGLPAAPTHP